MPRKRIPTINVSIPHRPDGRRRRGNATGAQHRPPRGRRGQVETIAERRTIALELRKAGGSYREIARQLSVDVHTAHADVAAELAALRETTIGRAEELRALELERFDRMVEGLWPQIRGGNPPAVSAAVRVSERRSRLLGLDEPTATKTEVSGSLGVATDTRLKAMREDLLQWLDFDELRALGEASDKLFTNAISLVEARKSRMKLAGSPSPAVGPEPPALVGTAMKVVCVNGVQPSPATAPDATVDSGEINGEPGESLADTDSLASAVGPPSHSASRSGTHNPGAGCRLAVACRG